MQTGERAGARTRAGKPKDLPGPEPDVSPANQRRGGTWTCFPQRLPPLAGPVSPQVTVPTKDPLLGIPPKGESRLAPAPLGLGKRKAGNTPHETWAQRAGETQFKG